MYIHVYAYERNNTHSYLKALLRYLRFTIRSFRHRACRCKKSLSR